MSFYMLAYYGGEKPDKPEHCEGHMMQWESWEENLGDDLIDPGKPLGNSKILSSTGVKDPDVSNPLSGFSILEAGNIDTALEMVKDNPHLNVGGTIEIAELLETCCPSSK